MLIDERYEVETPEGAMLSLSLAGPVTRAMAYGVDLMAIFLADFAAFSTFKQRLFELCIVITRGDTAVLRRVRKRDFGTARVAKP